MKVTSYKHKETKKVEKVYEIWEAMEYFGSYQKIQYLYVCIATAFVSMYNINYIFVAGDINYRCHVPHCENTPAQYQVDWWPNSTIDRCSRPIFNSSDTCGTFKGLVEECNRWVYESNETIIGETDIYPPLPYIFFGCTSIMSGLLTTLTPETKDLPLMDTVEQVEASVQKKKTAAENLEQSRRPSIVPA